LYQIWDAYSNPNDPVFPYTPYTFTDAQMTMDLSMARRESVQTIPGLDSVLDTYGGRSGPFERRDFTWGFRIITKGGADAAYDLLMAAILVDRPVRLVYKTDSGALWFNKGQFLRIDAQYTIDHRYYVDVRVTWRVQPYWKAQFSELADIWGVNDGIWGTNDGLWGQGFWYALTISPLQTFAIDARGTAGTNLPTIGDVSPLIQITANAPPSGYVGGDQGIRVTNGNARYVDTDGTLQPTRLTVPFALLGNYGCTLDCAKRSFTVNGADFRPIKNSPAQPWYFKVEPGVLNNIGVEALGANQAMNGIFKIDWIRKRG
jgi:hypothetical protein